MPTLNTAFPDTFQGHPRLGFPNSLAELKRAQIRGPLYDFLRNYATRDVVGTLFDDFVGKTIDTTNTWAVANGGGASVASFALNLQQSGVIRATTGTANGVTASASLIGPINIAGTSNPGIEVRFKGITAVTSVKMEFGFIDAVPAGTTGGVNNMDTPTAFMANGALGAIDTTATANLFNLVTVGTATNQAIKKTNGTTGLAAAGTYQTIRLQLFSRDNTTANAVDVVMWHNGVIVATHDVSATLGVGAVNGSVLLAPWVYVEALNATSKSLDVDYISVWSDRI